jgi:hypothetical protein
MVSCLAHSSILKMEAMFLQNTDFCPNYMVLLLSLNYMVLLLSLNCMVLLLALNYMVLQPKWPYSAHLFPCRQTLQRTHTTWRVSYSGMWRRVVCWDATDVSEEHIASIFRVEETFSKSNTHNLFSFFLPEISSYVTEQDLYIKTYSNFSFTLYYNYLQIYTGSLQVTHHMILNFWVGCLLLLKFFPYAKTN